MFLSIIVGKRKKSIIIDNCETPGRCRDYGLSVLTFSLAILLSHFLCIGFSIPGQEKNTTKSIDDFNSAHGQDNVIYS